MTSVRVNRAAIKALAGDSGIKSALSSVGRQAAQRAAQLAPKDTGAGAASISHRVGEDAEGAFVHVSWDAAHSYMAYVELGTSRMSARPFLRPALDAHYDV